MNVRAKVLAVSPILLACAGCQCADRVFYRAGVRSASHMAPPRVILAADFGPLSSDASQAEQGTANGQATAPAPGSTPSAQPPASETKPAPDAPVVKKKYTAPSDAIRRLMLAALATTSTQNEDENGIPGGGREAAEAASAQTGLLSAIGGRPGLVAPPPAIGNTLGGQAGLQRGFATGIGLSRNAFESRPTLFNLPQTPVRVSGAGGRCRDLVGAGFFSNAAACEAQLGRSKRR